MDGRSGRSLAFAVTAADTSGGERTQHGTVAAPPDRHGASPDLIGPVLCVAVGATLAAVLLARWSGGWLLLLDWAPGPEPSSGALGLPSGPAIALLADLSAAVSPASAGWGLVAGGVVATYAGGVRLGRCWHGPADRPLSWWVLPLAGLVAASSPFVASRVYSGQVSVLWGSATAWFLVASLLRSTRRHGGGVDLRPALWCGLAAAFSLHLLVVGAAIAAVVGVVDSRRVGPGRAALDAATFCVVSTALTAVWAVPRLLGSGDSLGSPGGEIGARVFASGGPLDTLWFRAAGGAGFWRALPAGSLTAFGIVLAAAWAATLLIGWRHGAGWSRPLRHVLAGCAVVGVLAAYLGRGITSEPWSWLITSVPAVGLLREPGKLALLATMLPAVGLAAAAQRLLDAAVRARSTLAVGSIALGAAVVVVLTLLSWSSFASILAPSAYPQGWSDARGLAAADDCAIAVVGDGAYTDPGFTRGRTVAHPAAGFFGERAVVSTDPRLEGLDARPTLSERQAWLEEANGRYLDDGEFSASPASAAAAGIGWVLVISPVDRAELVDQIGAAGFEPAHADDWAALWRVRGVCG